MAHNRIHTTQWCNTLVNLIRTVDLAIIGQADPRDDSTEYRDFSERVLLVAGRPVLVVPLHGVFSW